MKAQRGRLRLCRKCGWNVLRLTGRRSNRGVVSPCRNGNAGCDRRSLPGPSTVLNGPHAALRIASRKAACFCVRPGLDIDAPSICQAETCDVDGVAEAVFGEFRRAMAWPADIGGGMVDRRQVGRRSWSLAIGAATSCMKRAVARAMLQFRIASGERLDRLAEALQRHRIGNEAAGGRIGQWLVWLEFDAELAKIVTALPLFLFVDRLRPRLVLQGRRALGGAGGPKVSDCAGGAAWRLAGRRQQAPAGQVAMLEPVPIAARRPRFRAGLLAHRVGTGAVAGSLDEAARPACAINIAETTSTAIAYPRRRIFDASPILLTWGRNQQRQSGRRSRCITGPYVAVPRSCDDAVTARRLTEYMRLPTPCRVGADRRWRGADPWRIA